MKAQIAFLFVGILLVATNINGQEVNPLLQNQALVQREINCILGTAPCDAIGRQIMLVLPEALNNGCQRCTPYQARNARRLIAYMQETHPYEWSLIVQRYGNQSG